MSNVVQFKKPTPPTTQRVCGSCKFYQVDRTIGTWSVCHAVGGEKAHNVWPDCQGRLWQERPAIFKKLIARIRSALSATHREGK